VKFYRIRPTKSLNEYLNESALSINDLFKPANGAVIAAGYSDRIDPLIAIVSAKIPANLVGGLQTSFSPEQNQEILQILSSKDADAIRAALQRKKPFVDVNGTAYGITDFEKSAEFGGGGANAGAAQTAVQEVGQAVVLGLMNVIGSKQLSLSDLTEENLMRGAKTVQPDASEQVGEIFRLINADKKQSWGITFIASANALVKSGLNLSDKEFWRGGEWVEQLNKIWNAANKAKTPKPFVNINKWSPADIWAVKSGVVPPKVNTLEELNNWLIQQYHAGTVYGISLKKTSDNPSVHVYNLDPLKNQIKAVVKDLIVSRSNNLQNLFTNKGSRMTYSTESAHVPLSAYYKLFEDGREEVQYRQFNSGGNIAGEIQGKYAAHGKLGFGGMNKILRELTGSNITPQVDILAQIKKDKRSVIERIIQMAEETVGSYLGPKDRKQLHTIANNSNDDMLISKFQAVQLLNILVKARSSDNKAVDKFITQILQSAGSQAPLSGVFVKVS
jgi:hypothetical protein